MEWLPDLAIQSLPLADYQRVLSKRMTIVPIDREGLVKVI